GCDAAEVCTGTGAACPANVGLANGTVCRGSAGNGCDVAETCNGTASACPANIGLVNGTVCRGSAGNGCDVAETCNGTSAPCPANNGLPAGTVCRASTTPANQACDPQEVCNGTGSACPGNTVIRTPTAETCNSVDDNCNGVVDDGPATVCASAVNLGSITTGTSTSASGYVAAPVGSEQWYVMAFPGTSGGSPTITLSGAGVSGSPSIRMEVRTSCVGTPFCSGTPGTTWAFTDNTAGTGFYTRNVSWPAVAYVRLVRTTAPTTCGNFVINVSR
ncbi:MAG: hypothetical protein Q8S73_20135, partial [Deltaproteobacteria bacterium]|nr:hypothetical protein [Deltaproteobacteria bacterium]